MRSLIPSTSESTLPYSTFISKTLDSKLLTIGVVIIPLANARRLSVKNVPLAITPTEYELPHRITSGYIKTLASSNYIHSDNDINKEAILVPKGSILECIILIRLPLQEAKKAEHFVTLFDKDSKSVIHSFVLGLNHEDGSLHYIKSDKIVELIFKLPCTIDGVNHSTANIIISITSKIFPVHNSHHLHYPNSAFSTPKSSVSKFDEELDSCQVNVLVKTVVFDIQSTSKSPLDFLRPSVTSDVQVRKKKAQHVKDAIDWLFCGVAIPFKTFA